MIIPDLPPEASTLDWANAYAKAGIYVLPVKRGTKNPGSVVRDDWQTKSSIDPKVIAAWFMGTDHDIALDLGRSGLVAIDMDHIENMPDGMHKHLNIAAYQASRDLKIDPGRGHYLFEQPEGRRIGCSTGRLGGGWGQVRGVGGVIMAQPSFHVDGGEYRWIRTAVPVLPVELAEKLDDAGHAEASATPVEVQEFIDRHNVAAVPSVMAAWQKMWRDHMLAGDSRHTSAVSVVTGALKEAAAGLFSAGAFLDWFEPQFVAAKTRPPINGETQMTAPQARKVLWGYGGIVAWAVAQAGTADVADTLARTHQKTPSPVLAEHIHSEAQTMTDPIDLGDEPPAPWLTVDGAAFILDRPKNVPAIWGTGGDVLWPEGEGLMILGGQGLGKTTLAGQLVRGLLGLDSDVLGYPVNGSGEVILYLAMDRPRQIARSLARQFTEAEREMLKSRLLVRPGPPHADLAKNPELLAQMATELGAGIIIVDSVKDAAVGLSDDEVGASYNRARQYVLQAGKQMCDLHHVVKRGDGSIADAYGSVWLTSGCGSVITLTGDPGDPVVGFRHAKPSVNEVGPYRLAHDPIAGRLSIVAKADLLALASSSENGVTKQEAARAMNDTDEPSPAEVQQAARDLNKLVSKGVLMRIDGGSGGKGGGTPTRWYPA